jgi:VCBS repeat-containing protein
MATENNQPNTTPQALTLAVPAAGQTIVVDIRPNQVVDVPFDMADATITLVGADLRLEFAGGAVLILTNFATMVEEGVSPLMMFADGSVVAGDVILTALAAEAPETAAGGASGSGGAGEYEDDMGDLIAGINRLGVQDPDPFAASVELSLLDEEPPVLEEPPVPEAPVNRPPDAIDNFDQITDGDEVMATSGNLILDDDGLGVDSDPDGDALSIISINGDTSGTVVGAYGTLTWNPDGTYSYVLNQAGMEAAKALDDTDDPLTETFSYTLSDGSLTDTANLVITINGVNDPPTVSIIAEGDANIVYEAGLQPDGSGVGPTETVATGTIRIGDPDGLDDIVSIEIGGTTMTIGNGAGQFASLAAMVGESFTGAHGTLTLTGYANGEFTYEYALTENQPHVKPASDTTLTDSFGVTVSDGNLSASAQLTVTIVDDVPTVSFSNSLAPTSGTVLNGFWAVQPGADILPNLDYVSSVVLNSAKVDGVAATSFELGTGTYDGDGNLAYAGELAYAGDKAVAFTLTLRADGTYTVELSATPTRITIEPSEYVGAVKASGPTDTYILSYQDAETGELVTAKTFVADDGLPLSLLGVSDATGTATQLFTAATVGDQVNPSADGIGIENNIINSHVDSKGVMTAESLTFDPDGAADTITLNFKASGAPGFGQSGSDDVLYINVVGTEGDSQLIMLDSRYGDFVIDPDTGTAAPITGGYAGGGLDGYTIDNPFASGSIDYIEVTAGFYTYEQGQKVEIGTTEVKVSFGFTTETVTTVDLPVEMNFTATVTDADGDSDYASFTVQTLSGSEFVGSDGNDMITGTSGDDVIRGGEGGDLLIGGEGEDMFVFSARGGDGNDTILDFNPAEDSLRFTDVLDGYDDLADFAAHVEVMAEAGGDLVLTYEGVNGETTITLAGLGDAYASYDGGNLAQIMTDHNIDVDHYSS